jgi:L-alanine-DL-glutamate epimerase-like enolase superfamily enzyme
VAIDIAVWDLLGKIHQRPLHILLGGARESIATYISEIRLGAEETVDELLGRIDGYRADGYSTVKIKIGRKDFAEDLDRMHRVKRALGASGVLLVDLNQKWTVAEAVANAAKIDEVGLGWVEEPILYHDLEGYAALKRVMRTPVACGESLFGHEQVLQYLRAGAVDIVQADVAFVGGITEWRKIAHLAAAFGKAVAPHFMMELSAQVLCGVPNAFMLENVVGGSLVELGIAEPSVHIRNGIGRPSAEPGHGIVFDGAELARHVLDPNEVRLTFAGGSK